MLLATLLVTAAPAGTSPAPAWAAPTARALRRVGFATDVLDQPNFQSNLDCSELTYRRSDSHTMEAGCFMTTAYGLVNPDNDQVIFNGTDESVELVPFSNQQVLTPWPGTLDVLTLDAANTGGSYLGLYKNITDHLQPQRNIYGELTGKQVTAPPDVLVRDKDGRVLVINAQTMAFSDRGSWLVAETLYGVFVRINLATLDTKAFAPARIAIGSPGLIKSQVAVSPSGRYVAIETDSASEFMVYDLGSCADSLVTCPSYDYQHFVSSQITGLSSIRHLRFVRDDLISFNTSDSGGTDTYELAPSESIPSLIDYLALGDSYTSGEGAYDYLDGTDTGDNVCHLSARSYPLVITQELYSNASGHSVACSGAVIGDIAPSLPDKYPGQVRDGTPRGKRSDDNIARLLADYTPGELPQMDFVRQYQPGVLSISVGGDDIGFGDIVQNCVEPHISLHLSDGVCYDTYEDRVELKSLIDRMVPKWSALYKKAVAQAPGTRLYVIGYPQIAVDNGSCGLNVHLSKSELEFSVEIIDYLNGALSKAAAAANMHFVDISQALAGHRLCEAAGYDLAVNGLTAGTDAGILGIRVFGKESYHPNLLGQSLMADSILKQTNNFRVVPPASAPNSDGGQKLTSKPKSGRVITTKVPAKKIVATVIKKSKKTTTTFDGTANGLLPSSRYDVHLDGPTGPVVGSVVTDSDGQATGDLTIPDATNPGGHTVDIIGPGEGNDPVDASQPVYIPASDTDSDGDGLLDTNDSCPLAINSSVDADHDGIDDSCDGMTTPGSSASGAHSPASTSSGQQLGVTVSASSTASSGVASVSQAQSAQTHGNTTGHVLGAITHRGASTPRHLGVANGAVPRNNFGEYRQVPASKALLKRWTLWFGGEVLAGLVLLLIIWLLEVWRRKARQRKRRRKPPPKN